MDMDCCAQCHLYALCLPLVALANNNPVSKPIIKETKPHGRDLSTVTNIPSVASEVQPCGGWEGT